MRRDMSEDWAPHKTTMQVRFVGSPLPDALCYGGCWPGKTRACGRVRRCLMKSRAVSMFPLLVLCGAIGYGCATEIEAGDPSPIDVTEGAVTEGNSPGCEGGYLGECRDGNAKMCKKY